MRVATSVALHRKLGLGSYRRASEAEIARTAAIAACQVSAARHPDRPTWSGGMIVGILRNDDGRPCRIVLWNEAPAPGQPEWTEISATVDGFLYLGELDPDVEWVI